VVGGRAITVRVSTQSRYTLRRPCGSVVLRRLFSVCARPRLACTALLADHTKYTYDGRAGRLHAWSRIQRQDDHVYIRLRAGNLCNRQVSVARTVKRRVARAALKKKASKGKTSVNLTAYRFGMAFYRRGAPLQRIRPAGPPMRMGRCDSMVSSRSREVSGPYSNLRYFNTIWSTWPPAAALSMALWTLSATRKNFLKDVILP